MEKKNFVFRGNVCPPQDGEVVMVYPSTGGVYYLSRLDDGLVVGLQAGDCSPTWEEHCAGISWRDVRARKEKEMAYLLTEEIGEEVRPE